MAISEEDLQRLRDGRATQEEINRLRREALTMTREQHEALEAQLEGNRELQGQYLLLVARARETADALEGQVRALKDAVNAQQEGIVKAELLKALTEAQNDWRLAELANLREQLRVQGSLNAVDQGRLETLMGQERYLLSAEQAYQSISAELDASVGIQDSVYDGTVKWVTAIQSGQAQALLTKKAYAAIDAQVEAAFSKLYNSAKDLVFQFDSLTKGFERQLQLGPEYTQSIKSQYQALNEYGVTIEDATKAQTDLIKTVTDFTLMTGTQQDKLREFTAVAGELGVATGDYTQGIQNSMKMMGRSVDGAIEAQGELAATARQLGLDQGEFAAKFAASGGALAKFGDQGVQAFKDLAHISKITGMEMEKILQLTNKFDTFEDAAEMTGKLNAALGGNMVNAMDMMMTTDPAERFGMIRDSILDAGLSFDDMSYYQKQFYTESLGLSDVGDLAMMLSGNMDDLTDSTDQSAESLIAQKKRAQEVQNIEEKWNAVIQDLSASFIGFAEVLSSVVGFLQEYKFILYVIIGAMIIYKAVMIAAAMAQAITTVATIIGSTALAGFAMAAAAATGGLILMIPLLIGLALGLKKMWEHGGAAKGIVIALGIAVAAFLIQATGGLILLVPLIIGIVMGLKKVWNAFQEGATWAKVFVGVLAVMFLPITALIGGFKLLGMGLSALGDHWDTVVDGVVAGATFLFNMLTWPWRMAFETITNIWEFFFGKSLSPFMESIVTGIQAGVDIILKLLTAPFEMAMTLITAIMDPKKILALGLLLGGIILAAPFLPIAAVGLAAFAVGLGSLGLALAMIKTEDLQAIALFTSSMAEVEIEKMNALAESIVRIAEAIKEIPTSTALAMSATMTAASVVGPDIAAAVLGATGGAAGGGGGERPYNVTIQLELDGDVLAKTQKEFLGGRVRDALFGQ